MVQSPEQLDSVTSWVKFEAQQTSNAMMKPCFRKFTGLEPKLNPAQGKEWKCVCVCVWVNRVVRLLNSITANYHNYVHFSSLPESKKLCVHLMSPTFENITVKLKVSSIFWLNIVLSNDCLIFYSFSPPLNDWLLSDIRAPFALITLASLQNS